MKNTALILWTMILVAVVTGYGVFTIVRNMQQLREPYRVAIDYKKLAREHNLGAKEFVLTNQDGKLFYSKELKGKVWILNFFFTSCTQNCHRTNKALAELQRKFPNDDLMILSISCNPELDETEVLKVYSQQFHADLKHWQFLTGDFNEIKERIAKQFLLDYQRGSHQDKVIVVGRDGVWRDTVELLKQDQFDKLAVDLRTWLDEPAPIETSSAQPESVKPNAALPDATKSEAEKKGP